jgi:hypothetical protein
MRRALVVLAMVAALGVGGTAYAKTDPKPIFARVGAALEAHGIVQCDAPIGLLLVKISAKAARHASDAC